MKSFLQKYGAYLAALILFLALGFIYCKPSLQGLVMQPGDEINAGAAVQESVEYNRQTGDYTWWTGSMFSGRPA